MEAKTDVQKSDMLEATSGGEVVAVQNGSENQKDGGTVVDSLLEKVAKYEIEVKQLSEQLNTQKHLCEEEDKSQQAFRLRLHDFKSAMNTEINKIQSREQFLFQKAQELSKVVEVTLKHTLELKGIAGGGGRRELKEGALEATERELLEIMTTISGFTSSVKDTKCSALNNALNSLLEGDATAQSTDTDDSSSCKLDKTSSPPSHPPSPPPSHLPSPPPSHLPSPPPSRPPPPLPPKSSSVVPSTEVIPNSSPSLSMPQIPPRSKKGKSHGCKARSSENTHSSSDSDFEHFVPPSSRSSTRENSMEPLEASLSTSLTSSGTSSLLVPTSSQERKSEGVRKSNSDPKSNKVVRSLPRSSPKKMHTNRSKSLSALEKNNVTITTAGAEEEMDEENPVIADSSSYSKPFDHLFNWKQMMLEEDGSSGQELKYSLSMSIGSTQSVKETATLHGRDSCDPKGQSLGHEGSVLSNRHSAVEPLLHRKDSATLTSSRKNSSNSTNQELLVTLHRESSTADGYMTAAEIATAVVGARQKTAAATTPTKESIPDYLPIIPSSQSTEKQHGDREPNQGTKQLGRGALTLDTRTYRHSQAGLASTMGRRNAGGGASCKEQVSKDSYLRMVKSDSNSSLQGSGAHSIGPLPLYTKRSSVKGTQLVALVKRTKSERIVKSTVDSPKRRHSTSIDVEYQIPPDAEEGYVEENKQKASIPLKYRNSITFNTPGKETEACEKSGYLQKYDMKQRRVAKRWFVLRDSELKYYRAKETFFGIGRARGVIDLSGWCKVSRCITPTTFQLDTAQKTYHLVAESVKECEEWLKAICVAMQSSKSFVSELDKQRLLSGWAEVAYSGHRRKLWCSLVGTTLGFAPGPDNKNVIEVNLEKVSVKHDHLHQEANYELDDEGGTISLVPNDASSSVIEITVGSTEEMSSWMFHLTKSSGGPILTLIEKLIVQAKLGGAPTNILWSHPVMISSRSTITQSLTTLPSSDLFVKVKNIFQSIQLFMETPINCSALDYHIHAVQHITKTGIRYPDLQNEIYCLVLQQMFGQDSIGLRGWLLLFLLTMAFVPTGNILWYVCTMLEHFASNPKPPVAEMAQVCQSNITRTQKNGPRECKPSKLELQHILSQNVSVPNSIQVKMKLPVHLTNGTSVELEYFMSTTVQEFVSHLNQEIGMPDVSKTGFALMSDWPGVEDCSLFYLLPTSKLCDIISMWYDSLEELNPIRVRQPRMINLTYRNRLSLQVRNGLESEKEAVLLAYQVNNEIISGRYLIAKTENIFKMAAYMCQIEYGEWNDPHRNVDVLIKEGLDKFYPKSHLRQSPLQQDQVWLQNLLSAEWKSLQGYSRQQCAQKYLQAARSWQFSMSTLLQAEERIFCQANPRNRAIWLVIQESGVSVLDRTTMECLFTHSFKEITTFGNHGDDFMLVVSPQPGAYPVRPDQVIPEAQKYFISMPKLQVREATLLMASYLEVLEQ